MNKQMVSAPLGDQPRSFWSAQLALLQAIAWDTVGDTAAANSALAHALELAEPEANLLPFLLFPAPGLLDRHAASAGRYAPFIRQVLAALRAQDDRPGAGGPRPLTSPLSVTEQRVLLYLPTHLSAGEIARELEVSLNTIKTHLRHLYSKLDAHGRAQAVRNAQAAGLLAPRLAPLPTPARRRPSRYQPGGAGVVPVAAAYA